GQRIAVIPSKDLVVVITGAGLNADDVTSLIAPAWRWDSSLAPNPQGDAKLAGLVAQAAAAPTETQWAATTATPSAATTQPLATPAAQTNAAQPAAAPVLQSAPADVAGAHS